MVVSTFSMLYKDSKKTFFEESFLLADVNLYVVLRILFFRVFHIVRKHVNKLKLLTQWKIYNICHVLLLEQDITRKRRVIQVNQALSKPKKCLVFKAKNNKKYKVKIIINSTIYSEKANDQILNLYYLVL